MKTIGELTDHYNKFCPRYKWEFFNHPILNTLVIQVTTVGHDDPPIRLCLHIDGLNYNRSWNTHGYNTYVEAAITDLISAMDLLERWSQ